MHILQTIGWVCYFLVSFAVVCVGTFGISATKSERKQVAIDSARLMLGYRSTAWKQVQAYKKLTAEAFSGVFVVAFFWPVGIPLYFAWKKGSFINDALEKREKSL